MALAPEKIKAQIEQAFGAKGEYTVIENTRAGNGIDLGDKNTKPHWHKPDKKDREAAPKPSKHSIEDLTKSGYTFGVMSRGNIDIDHAASKEILHFGSQAFNASIAQILEDVPERTNIPFYITSGDGDIPHIKEVVRKFCEAENGTSPILGFLSLLTEEQRIPDDNKYDKVRALKEFCETQTDILRIHCPDPRYKELETRLNQALTKQRNALLVIALYKDEFKFQGSFVTSLAPYLAIALGTGAALGIDAFHMKNAIDNGFVIGGAYTGADGADNWIGSGKAQKDAIRRRTAGVTDANKIRKITHQVRREYAANAIKGAFLGLPFNATGGLATQYGGIVGHDTGEAILSVMTSASFAADAKNKQDRNTEAYENLMERSIIPPCDGMSIKESAKTLGKLETIANRVTTLQNLAMAGTAAFGLIPASLKLPLDYTHLALLEHLHIGLQNTLIAGSENINNAFLILLEKAKSMAGGGWEAKLAGNVASGEDLKILESPKTFGAIQAQAFAYNIGILAEAPGNDIHKVKDGIEKAAGNVRTFINDGRFTDDELSKLREQLLEGLEEEYSHKRVLAAEETQLPPLPGHILGQAHAVGNQTPSSLPVQPGSIRTITVSGRTGAPNITPPRHQV